MAQTPRILISKWRKTLVQEKMKELMEKAKEAGITLVKPSTRKKAGNSRAGRKVLRFTICEAFFGVIYHSF